MWHRVSTFNCAASDYIVCGLTNIWPHSSPTLEIHLGGWTGASESGSGKEPLFHQAFSSGEPLSASDQRRDFPICELHPVR